MPAACGSAISISSISRPASIRSTSGTATTGSTSTRARRRAPWRSSKGAVFPIFGPFRYRGGYTFGAWYQTAGGPGLYYNCAGLPLGVAGGTPLAHQERSGLCGVAIQELYRPNPDEPCRNPSAFTRVTFADPHTSAIDEKETVGLVYKGLWDDRPADWIGIAIGQSHASAAVAKGFAVANAFDGAYRPVPAYERVTGGLAAITWSDPSDPLGVTHMSRPATRRGRPISRAGSRAS